MTGLISTVVMFALICALAADVVGGVLKPMLVFAIVFIFVLSTGVKHFRANKE
jgi:hypothetical protein